MNAKYFCLLLFQAESIFEVLKAHLKRAPSLKGAALVKLSQLKVQAYNWPQLKNISAMTDILDQVDITADDWIRNILLIYKAKKVLPRNIDLSISDDMNSA